MPQVDAHLNIESNATNIQELNKEIGQLKLVIGFILAKLDAHDAQKVIDELKDWGLNDSSEEFDQFVNIRPPVNK